MTIKNMRINLNETNKNMKKLSANHSQLIIHHFIIHNLSFTIKNVMHIKKNTVSKKYLKTQFFEMNFSQFIYL